MLHDFVFGYDLEARRAPEQVVPYLCNHQDIVEGESFNPNWLDSYLDVNHFDNIVSRRALSAAYHSLKFGLVCNCICPIRLCNFNNFGATA